MAIRLYPHMIFNRPARYTRHHAFIWIVEVGVEAKFDRAHILELLKLLPRGRLWVQANNAGRNLYLRLKPRMPGESENNFMVIRLIAALEHLGGLDHREVRHRNGNRWDFTSQNLMVTETRRCRASDKTHQALSRWRWRASQ